MPLRAKHERFHTASAVPVSWLIATLAFSVHAGEGSFNDGQVAQQLLPAAASLVTLDSNVWHYTEKRIDKEFNREYRVERVTLAAALDWQRQEDASSYASYSETHHASTRSALYCGNWSAFCQFQHKSFPGAPALPRASQTFQTGVHGGTRESIATHLRWSIAPFITLSEDEIAFVDSMAVTNPRHFENIRKTKRRGIEAVLSAIDGKLRWFASYAYMRATFEESFLVLSNRTQEADDVMQVSKGDNVPGVPLHSARIGISYAPTPRWQIALDTITTSSQVSRGDGSHDQPRVDDFTIVSARGSYRIANDLEAFVQAENILDTEYQTFRTLGSAADIPLREYGYPATDPRFLGPGAPRGIWIGLRFSR